MFSFGGVSVAADPTAGLRTLLYLISLLDPEAVIEQLTELHAAMEKHNHQLALIAQRERALEERERSQALTAERLHAYEADIAEKEQVAKAQIESAAREMAKLQALRAEMKSWAVAA
jgi:hypothetical protein